MHRKLCVPVSHDESMLACFLVEQIANNNGRLTSQVSSSQVLSEGSKVSNRKRHFFLHNPNVLIQSPFMIGSTQVMWGIFEVIRIPQRRKEHVSFRRPTRHWCSRDSSRVVHQNEECVRHEEFPTRNKNLMYVRCRVNDERFLWPHRLNYGSHEYSNSWMTSKEYPWMIISILRRKRSFSRSPAKRVRNREWIYVIIICSVLLWS